MCLVSLLNHGAEQTREFVQLALQERLAKIHIAQEPIDRVGQRPIRSGGEQAVRPRREVAGRRYRQIFLAREVMEEGALGDACAVAELLHGGPRITPGADDIHGNVQQSCLRTGSGFSGWHAGVDIPSGRYGVKMTGCRDNSRARKRLTRTGAPMRACLIAPARGHKPGLWRLEHGR
jgi:hypothetical protein